MTDPTRAAVRRTLVVLGLGCATLCTWVAVAGEVPGDRRLLKAIHDTVDSRLHDPASTLSDATSSLWLAAASMALTVALLAHRRWWSAVRVAIGVGGVLAVNPLIKRLFARDRPDVRSLGDDVSEYGFPSGHAAGSMALGLAVVLIGWRSRWRVPVLLAAVAVMLGVGASQLVLGRHYPSDLVVGWLWAAGWVLLAWSWRLSGRSGAH